MNDLESEALELVKTYYSLQLYAMITTGRMW